MNVKSKAQEAAETLLYKSILSCKKAFWFIFFFSCIINVLVMIMPIYTMQILDRVVTSQSVDTLILLTIIAFVATFVMILLEGCRTLVLQKIGEWLEFQVSNELILKALAFTVTNPGASGSQFLRDINNIRSFVGGQILVALFDLPWAVLFFVMMLIINPKIAFFAFIGIILLALLAMLTEATLGKKMKAINELQVRNYSEIETAIKNAEIVEAMGMGPAMIRLWNRKNKLANEMQDQTNFTYVILSSVSKLLKIVLNTFILAGGIYFSLNTSQPVGGILACSMLMGRVMAPIDILIASSKVITAARASYSRLQSILISVPLRNEGMELPAPTGHIQVDKIFFVPAGSGRPTIKSVSFEIMPGDCMGIIGPSGSGKSTLTKLLVGVWQAGNGSLKLDGADIYTYNREHFGKYIGYVPQDIELFNTSIKSNIARLSDEVEPNRVVKAAKIAGVHELILSLPNGYDTIIGPGGVTLSGGQKQRIALARAFYGDIRLLVLDEPNSNLDQAGEQSLVNAIQYAKHAKITVIFTTHKLNMIGVTNKLLLMQDGMVGSFGETQQVIDMLQKQQPNSSSQQQTPSANQQEQNKDFNTNQNNESQNNPGRPQENSPNQRPPSPNAEQKTSDEEQKQFINTNTHTQTNSVSEIIEEA